MRTFDRYLLSQLLTLFGFFSLVLVAVYWVNRAVSLFDRLVTGGQNISIFLEFTALALPQVIASVLPVAALVATLYGVNRLTQDSELVVAQAAGLGPWLIARPVAVFGLVVGGILLVFTHGLVPTSRAALSERGSEISRDVSAKMLTEGEFLHPARGITVYVREISDTGELRGILLQDRRASDSQTIYTAERALLVSTQDAPRLIMLEGMAQTLRDMGKNLTVVTFSDFTYDLADLARSGPKRPALRELPTTVLLAERAQDIEDTGETLATFRAEAHGRFADAALAAVLPLMALGALLVGRYSRLGLWRQILATVALAIVVQLTANVAEAKVLSRAALWPLIYAAPALALAFGLGGLWLAARGGLRGLRVARLRGLA